MKAIHWLAAPLLALGPLAWGAGPPVTGGALQPLPPLAAPVGAAPGVDVQRNPLPPPPEADGLKLVIRSLRISGAQRFPEAELLQLTGFQPGTALALSELRAMAQRITRYYQQNGYLVAQAYLPAQDINDGAVTIAVSEGRYSQIVVRNQSQVMDKVATRLLDGVNPGDVVTAGVLESRLLLLSDLPGVVVKSTLMPGASYGTSDLLVELQRGPRVTGNVEADNAGNRYTGAWRVGATINLNEPLGLGDQASVLVLTSGKGLNYGRASYEMQAGKGRVGLAVTNLEYALGREFEGLIAHGTSRVTSFHGSYPLVRSRKTNLSAGLAYDAKRFHDQADATVAVTDKTAHVLTASLHGNHYDGLWGGGLTSYALHVSSGDLIIETPSARAVDSTSAQSNGHFGKFGFNASRLQAVTPLLSLCASVSGQAAAKNLDISEKMDLGGLYAVRAYPEGEAYGDEGYLVSLEARLQLPGLVARAGEQMQLIGFVDAGGVTLNKSPWALDANRRTLKGAGVGLNWSQADDFVVRMYYARKLGHEPARSAPDASGRFWIQAVSYF